MATINIANLTFTHKGDYDGSTAYVKNDVVYYATNGNAYIAKQNTTGNAPTNATYWNQFAQGSGGIWNAGLSLGSASQKLRVNSGGNALEFFTEPTVAQNIDIISHQVLDSTGVNSITTTTDWSTNNYYKIEAIGIYQLSANNHGVGFRVRNASGNITSDSYQYSGWHHYEQENHGGAVYSALRDLDGSRFNLQVNGWGFNSSEVNPMFRIQAFKPDQNNRQHIKIHYLASDTSSPTYHANYNFDAWNNDTSVKTGYNITGDSSTNLKNGFITTLGHKYQ